jgi:hypothetical protein
MVVRRSHATYSSNLIFTAIGVSPENGTAGGMSLPATIEKALASETNHDTCPRLRHVFLRYLYGSSTHIDAYYKKRNISSCASKHIERCVSLHFLFLFFFLFFL